MGCDIYLALGPATVQGQTLVGLNHFAADQERCQLRHWPAGHHSPDETIHTCRWELPQVRQTCALLGLQPEGAWGLRHGCNEHQVALAAAHWRTRLPESPVGLTGAELVRLALERSHSARQAVDIVTDLIAHHGHANAAAEAASIFLIADPREAFVVEAVGTHWALVECQQTRAVTDVGLIRQDWDRVSHGLAELAIHNGWWRDDGTKLDFAGSLGGQDGADAGALRRWGKATLALAQQAGALDPYVLRRLMAEHHEACARKSPVQPPLTASLVSCLDGAGTGLTWFAVGAAACRVFVPLIVDAPIPDVWLNRPPSAVVVADAETATARARLARMQQLFDQDAEEFLVEARLLKQRGECAALRRLAQAMMLRHVEQWESPPQPPQVVSLPSRRPTADEELVPFAFG